MGWDRPPPLKVFGFPLSATDLYAKGTACHAVPIALIPIILGALEELRSPDAWQGEPEDVALALQQMGHFIGTWGTRYSECEGEIITQYEAVPTGGGLVVEDDDMGQVVTDVQPLDDGTGIRIFFGPCCWHDINLIDLLQDAALPPPSGEDTPDMPESVDLPTACDKVIRWTDLLFDVIGTLISKAHDAEPPGSAIHTVKVAWPTITWGETDLYLAYSAAINIALGGVADETQLDNIRQEIRCRLVELVSDGPQGITKSEYEDMQDALSNFVNGVFGVAAFNLTYAAMRQIYITTARAIGAGDTEKWTTWAPTTVTYDCECPGSSPIEGPTIPDSNGWYWSAVKEETVEAVGDYVTALCLSKSHEQDAFGLRFVLERTDDNKNYKRMSSAHLGCSGGSDAWGDTSDHLEWASQQYVWVAGNQTLMQTLFTAEGKVEYTDWQMVGSTAYGTPDNPASPVVTQGTVIMHGFEGSGMGAGHTYTVKMRWLFNINSPSHQ